jgi:hypothetical protein
MFVTSLLHVIPAHLLLLSCMLVTSLLHVILVVSTNYFSRIYQSSLFLVHEFPSHPCFHTIHLSAITACMAVLHLHSPVWKIFCLLLRGMHNPVCNFPLCAATAAYLPISMFGLSRNFYTRIATALPPPTAVSLFLPYHQYPMGFSNLQYLPSVAYC